MRPIEIITQLLELIVALAVAPLFVGWINQCRAWLQNKSAPSLLQPYRTIRKLFHKDAVLEIRLAGEPVLLVRRRDLVARFGE